jgi:hypothetical protein
MESVDDNYHRPIEGSSMKFFGPIVGRPERPFRFPKNFVDKAAGAAIFVVIRLEP